MKMWRLWILFGSIIVLYGGIFLRLFYWQVIVSSSLQVKAVSQYTEKQTLFSKRGDILTSDGSRLATQEPSYLVFAEPHRVDDPFAFARLLAPLLEEKEENISNLLQLPDRKWVAIAKKVNSETKEKLEATQLKGLGFELQSMRFYPEASMAAHVLGFLGLDSMGEGKGYFGLEGYYNRELSGKDGSVVREKDARGSLMLIGDERRVEPEHGRNLTLWLDRSIQYIVETHLKEGMKKYGALEGTVVVMNPTTGGILGMASYPSYDPYAYERFDEVYYKNPAVAGSYEPGSTFKPLVMAAAINEGQLHADSTFEETGPVKIGEYTIRTWDEKYHNTMTMTDVLRYSSNVGMVFVQKKLGEEKILQYIHDFGFGDQTGIDLEEESSPSLREGREWREIDYATASFGQGIAVTPLQMVRAIGAIANNGWLMEPKLVKEFVDADGKVVVQKAKKVKQVLTQKTTKEITDMMVAAVQYGEAKWAAPKGYKVAGKTGTAQIPVSGHYDEEKTIASFVGFAPAYDPKFVMLVILREPQTSQWGSETAAPLFFAIAKDLFHYLGISPTN